MMTKSIPNPSPPTLVTIFFFFFFFYFLICLEKFFLNTSYIFLLNVNFENLIFGLYVFYIPFFFLRMLNFVQIESYLLFDLINLWSS